MQHVESIVIAVAAYAASQSLLFCQILLLCVLSSHATLYVICQPAPACLDPRSCRALAALPDSASLADSRLAEAHEVIES